MPREQGGNLSLKEEVHWRRGDRVCLVNYKDRRSVRGSDLGGRRPLCRDGTISSRERGRGRGDRESKKKTKQNKTISGPE